MPFAGWVSSEDEFFGCLAGPAIGAGQTLAPTQSGPQRCSELGRLGQAQLGRGTWFARDVGLGGGGGRPGDFGNGGPLVALVIQPGSDLRMGCFSAVPDAGFSPV